MWRRAAVPVALLCLSNIGLSADTLPNEQDRLLSTANLWATVEYFHPYLAYRNIDWDGALIQTLPAIRSARNESDYASALSKLIGHLQDDLSYIEASPSQAKRQVSQEHANTSDSQGERVWVHYGATSAFLTRAKGESETASILMGGNVKAVLRLSEPVTKVSPASPTIEGNHGYNAPAYPSVEYRILAAYKLWAAVKYFFAYKDLMDQDWDQAFAGFLPKFINAKDGREYNLAVAEAVTLLDDSNARITSADLDKYFGIAPLGLRTRLVEKKPVVTEVLDDEAKKAGVQVGDVITKVDGEDVVARIHRYIAYISASTDQSLAAEVVTRLFNGPENSTAALTVQSRNAQEKQFSLKRSGRFVEAFNHERTDAPTKFLSRAIGYVDLNRLTDNQIDSVFEQFQSTTALILDGRGKLTIDPALLSTRVAEKPGIAMAIVTGPVNLAPDIPGPRTVTQSASFFRVETLPPSNKPHYKGKTIMLTDERTVGAAELLGLQLETANNTAFVGGLSAGAEAEVTKLDLPGGIAISFSATDVRHANGGKLQRVGLQPAEMVQPTVSGVRSGRDEVLEKALDFVAR